MNFFFPRIFVVLQILSSPPVCLFTNYLAFFLLIYTTKQLALPFISYFTESLLKSFPTFSRADPKFYLPSPFFLFFSFFLLFCFLHGCLTTEMSTLAPSDASLANFSPPPFPLSSLRLFFFSSCVLKTHRFFACALVLPCAVI